MKNASIFWLGSALADFAKPSESPKKKKVFNDDLLMPFYPAAPSKGQNKAGKSVRKDSSLELFPFF